MTFVLKAARYLVLIKNLYFHFYKPIVDTIVQIFVKYFRESKSCLSICETHRTSIVIVHYLNN